MQTLLNECFDLCIDIAKKDNEITELRLNAMSSKIQTFSDMPKGSSNTTSPTERFMLALERKQNEKNCLKAELNEKWNVILTLFDDLDIEDENAELAKQRYYHGYKWSRCANCMKKKYPNNKWNLNKCYRVNRMLCDIIISK